MAREKPSSPSRALGSGPGSSFSDLLCCQPFQHGHLLGVGTAARAGHLENERKFRQPRLVQEGAKALLADLAGSDVRVAVAVGTQPGDRIVAVDNLDAGESTTRSSSSMVFFTSGAVRSS